MLQIYTDGSCINNKLNEKNKGGFGIVIVKQNQIIHTISKQVKNTTNNKMELLAIIESLIYCLNKGWQNQEIIIYSDSQYCVQGCSVWINNWKKYHYTKKGDFLLNSDIWLVLDSLKNNFEFLSFEWIKAHNGHQYNELADSLAEWNQNALI